MNQTLAVRTPVNKTASLPTTTLAGMLNDQPWNAYSFGLGINAESGAFANQAVTPFDVSPSVTKNTVQTYKVIATESDYEQLFAAEAEGTYNIGAGSVSASASFMNSVAISETTLTIVAFYEIVDADYGVPTPPQPALTTEAQQIANGDPSAFRDQFGDYYVANAQFGSRFVATYTCSAISSEVLQSFKTAVAGNSDILTASGAAAFQSAASSSNVSVAVSVSMDGVAGVPPPVTDASGILLALNWFTKNTAPAKLRARLIHYSQLDPSIPKTLPIDPDNFAKIQLIAFQLQQSSSTLSALPPYYQTVAYQLDPPVAGVNTVQDAKNYLSNKFSDSLGMLPYDPAAADRLSEQVSALNGFLQPSLALVSLYNSLTKTPPGEPASGVYSTAAGYNTLPNVTVNQVYQNYSAGWHIGHRDNTFVWPWAPYDANQIIVGWYIHNVWASSSNGSWNRDTALIGQSSGSLSVSGDYDRGVNWTFYVYFVDLNAFPWL